MGLKHSLRFWKIMNIVYCMLLFLAGVIFVLIMFTVIGANMYLPFKILHSDQWLAGLGYIGPIVLYGYGFLGAILLVGLNFLEAKLFKEKCKYVLGLRFIVILLLLGGVSFGVSCLLLIFLGV